MTPTRTLGPSPLFEAERYAWTRRRTTRRSGVAVEAVLLLVIAAVVLAAAVAAVGDGLTGAVVAVGLLAFIPLHSMVNLGVRGVFDRRDASLDEAQRLMRNRSFAATQPARVTLGLVGVMAAVFVALNAPVPGQAYMLGFVLWFVSWLLSTWHLAWTLPDEPADA